MELSDYLRSLKDQQRQALAIAAGTKVGYLYQLAGGHRRPSNDLALRIEEASGGVVTREELLPEFFKRRPEAA
jgi:DNA-binding transcriptional regulator YdaS (Cro superfamily)